jgi:murein DD-endopeptidase MepM/ murein hydrolase activator NlpD
VQSLVRLAIYLGVIASASTLVGLRARPLQANPAPPAALVGAAPPSAPCPPGTLPDNGVCIPVPVAEDDTGEALEPERNRHRTRSGEITEYDQIPRRPERPKDYRLYRYPVEPLAGQSLLMSGYDLHLPDDSQRRGRKLKATGHGGIDLAQKRGAEVRLVALEHQAEAAEVLYVGWLFGNSVVTLHRINEAGERREYIVIFGHLEKPARDLAASDVLDEGALLGYVGDSDSPGAVHLHLEIRQVRPGVEARALAPGEIVDNARTVACDPRNLLPLLAP